MSKPTKTTESRSRVLRLARMMREAGFDRLPADLIADRLGRPLSKAERRAHIIAQDSVAHPNALAERMAKHEARIADGATVKYAITRGFRTNQSSPKKHRTGGMRPLPKGEYMAKADLTGRGIDANAPKRFDGSEDQKKVPIRVLTGDRHYDRLAIQSDKHVIRRADPDLHDTADKIDRTRPVKMNRRESWEDEYKSK